MNAPAASSQFDLVAYEIQPGDNLHRIVSRYYGSMSHNKAQGIIQQILQANDHIRNPNLIRPGQIIKLSVPRQHCAAPKGFPHNVNLVDDLAHAPWFDQLNADWQKAAPEERAFMHRASPFLIGAGSTALSTVKTTFKSNAPLVGEVATLYATYQTGELTKNQYDYRRRKALEKLSRNLGPTQGLLYGERTPGEVIRISRRNGVSPTARIDREISRMSGLSKVASRGGVALSVAGLGIACHEIAHAESRDRQNEILVESAGGLFAGVVYGIGASLTLAIMATPVGWVGALLIGAGGAASGFGGSVLSRKIYDESGRKIDFVEEANIDTLCRKGQPSGSSATQQITRGLGTFQR